jgi:hemerythrin
MPNIVDFNIAANADTDREHEVQLGLLDALCTAAQDQRDPSSVAEILEQLLAYSEAHFMSEELLMRLKSYDEYEEHVADHEHMLEALRNLAEHHAAGDSTLVSGKAQEALGFIGNHIATRDRRFAAFVSSGK